MPEVRRPALLIGVANDDATALERVTIERAAPMIGLPVKTARGMAARGAIPGAARIGKRWTFDVGVLRAWIEGQQIKPFEPVRDLYRELVASGNIKPRTPTSLYRHFDASGRLLYVGVSTNSIRRLKQHQRSHWFLDIARVEIEHFTNRKKAETEEARAIATEKPLHNVVLPKVAA
jgi:hypothetical protein